MCNILEFCNEQVSILYIGAAEFDNPKLRERAKTTTSANMNLFNLDIIVLKSELSSVMLLSFKQCRLHTG